MCMWDVKVGRQAEAVEESVDEELGTASVRICAIDPNRISLIVAATFEDPQNNDCVVIFRSQSSAGPVVVTLTPLFPTLLMPISQYGQVVLGELWAVKVGAANVFCSCTGLRVNLPLEQL